MEQAKIRSEKLKANLEHPLVRAAFQSGYAFGANYKETGLAKLTDRELDAFALTAADKLKVPRDLLGHAVRNFKSGYGWGYWKH
jgi:hypothetical protein